MPTAGVAEDVQKMFAMIIVSPNHRLNRIFPDSLIREADIQNLEPHNGSLLGNGLYVCICDQVNMKSLGQSNMVCVLMRQRNTGL